MKSTKNCEELGIITFEKAKEVFTTKSFASRHLARLLARKEAFLWYHWIGDVSNGCD